MGGLWHGIGQAAARRHKKPPAHAGQSAKNRAVLNLLAEVFAE
ncbi:hypothetical protein [uncultured Cardiobacterium sp.]|nr:hypothetical protein [uncultured Cardiobacterium sp.]